MRQFPPLESTMANPDQRAIEDYLECRDKLEALDRLPQSDETDVEATKINSRLLTIESDYDREFLESYYDDSEKVVSKERQVQSYADMYRKQFGI